MSTPAHRELELRRLERLRTMTPAEKLAAAWRLYVSARELKAAYLRQAHPDWPEERVQREVRDAFLYART